MSRIFYRRILFLALVLFAGVLTFPRFGSAEPTAFILKKNIETAIVIPQNATLPEQTAASELQHYLAQITGGAFTIQNESVPIALPAIYVGATEFAKASGIAVTGLTSETWRIKTQNRALILAGGGTRGTLYAAYHFLEDVAGVSWWNPWEETIPKRGTFRVPEMDRTGKPTFAYRDIFLLYGNDEGRFMARSRLNRQGDIPVAARYGGSRDYGPPYHVHTFFMYLPPDKYYAAHPDWYIVKGNGPATSSNAQLAMSNPEMRQEFLKQLREMIRYAQRKAKEQGTPAPDVFNVSQEDNRVSFATAADADLLAENDGAESAIVLEFINFLADNIKDEFPNVYLDTLAYFSGEKPPKTVRPRDNVIVRLTDTTSNLIEPITSPRNHAFRENVENWSKLTNNLRVWDYAVTFRYPGLPIPTAHTYPTDLRFFLAHKVEGIFVEHHFPILADMRDFKIWMECKLFEDPHLDYDTMVRKFTDGFYGRAGKYVRQYITDLQNEAEKVGKAKGYENVHWMVLPTQSNFLSVEFVSRANVTFDKAARAAGTDMVLQRRVRHARMSLDRAIVLHHKALTAQWVAAGHTPESMPLHRDIIAARYEQTWNEQINLRLSKGEREAERKVAADEIARVTAK